jgi:ligand-binding SRPBCC domain-containing protein
MRHRLQLQQWVPYELSEVFDFFADPRNLPPLMPRWQGARIDRSTIVKPVPSSRMRGTASEHAAGRGSRLLISFRPVPFSPVRMHWDALIVEFAWDNHFCDEQVSGPFGYWRHCHRVREEVRGGVRGTVVTDDVTYAFPLGLLGDAAYVLGGALQVRALFRYRQRTLLKLLPSDRRQR